MSQEYKSLLSRYQLMTIIDTLLTISLTHECKSIRLRINESNKEFLEDCQKLISGTISQISENSYRLTLSTDNVIEFVRKNHSFIVMSKKSFLENLKKYRGKKKKVMLSYLKN